MNFIKDKKIRYVSEIDQFLQKFNREHAPSAAQQAEILKYAALNAARDQALSTSTTPHNHPAA